MEGMQVHHKDEDSMLELGTRRIFSNPRPASVQRGYEYQHLERKIVVHVWRELLDCNWVFVGQTLPALGNCVGGNQGDKYCNWFHCHLLMVPNVAQVHEKMLTQQFRAVTSLPNLYLHKQSENEQTVNLERKMKLKIFTPCLCCQPYLF